MKKISPAQKKIILITTVVLLAFLIFWLFIYLPAKNTIKRIKAELASVESQIEKIEAVIDKTRTIDEGIALLEEKYQRLDAKFIQKEEEGLRLLSDFAQKLKIEILSIGPKQKSPFLDTANQKVEIEGKVCQVAPVSIQMRSSYKELVRYLDALKESLPGFIAVEMIKITKDNAGAQKLNIALDFNLYLLS